MDKQTVTNGTSNGKKTNGIGRTPEQTLGDIAIRALAVTGSYEISVNNANLLLEALKEDVTLMASAIEGGADVEDLENPIRRLADRIELVREILTLTFKVQS